MISIVIATYRSRRDHLEVAIRSALAQTEGDLEVIVSDDTPDDTLRGFVAAFDDARLHYRRNDRPLGPAGNHWAAFAAARGEFIAILNHDDWFEPTFAARLRQALADEPSASVAFCDHWVVDGAGRRLDAETRANSAAWGRSDLAPGLHRPCTGLVVSQTMPVAMGALMRRATLPAAPAFDVGPAYDLWLAYGLARGGAGAVYVPERLSAWRSHGENLTSGGGMPWLTGSARCWTAIARDADYAPWRARVRRRAALALRSCAVRNWARGRRWDCLQQAAASLAMCPSWQAAAAGVLPLLPERWAPPRWRGRGAAA